MRNRLSSRVSAKHTKWHENRRIQTGDPCHNVSLFSTEPNMHGEPLQINTTTWGVGIPTSPPCSLPSSTPFCAPSLSRE